MLNPRRRAAVLSVILLFSLAGCVALDIDAINEPIETVEVAPAPFINRSNATASDTVIGLALSGGGTRAAAFGYGVLKVLSETELPGEKSEVRVADRVDFIAGVSGGSVTAAYFALEGRAGLAAFPERFLYRNAEEGLRTSVMPSNVVRLLGGGINDNSNLPAWLDKNVFRGATFGSIEGRGARLWINASDITARSVFVFRAETFDALCSDFRKYPLAMAVAASAAVPFIFQPVVLQNHASKCDFTLPEWVEAGLTSSRAKATVSAFADALDRYRDARSLPFVKLVDGGVTDNFGLQGFAVERAAATTPYGPLTPEQAVNLRRLLFLVVDAGRPPDASLAATAASPGAFDLAMAVTDTAIDASVRASFDNLEGTLDRWREEIVEWRCGLPAAQARRLGRRGGDCRDLKIFVGLVRFSQTNDETLQARLAKIPTRFVLERKQVDDLIEAARLALQNNGAWQGFLRTLGAGPG